MGPDQRERESGDHGEGARAHGTGDTGRRNGDRLAIRSFRRRRRRERGTGEPGGRPQRGVPRGDVRGITGNSKAPVRPVARGGRGHGRTGAFACPAPDGPRAVRLDQAGLAGSLIRPDPNERP
ncbi:hypothetical protein GCM10010287_53470 [Streptomyces variabilis]|uniref:Uncharacterized protein n=1 Tax=Streptomyces variabilis TaxID=67372 RepID=A0ABQ2U5S9_9ACTN|nr:hypothetical protein GCM10010265_08550 [Streptomyces griseoincarnatus]GGT72240.1 hypothetical protein GCM10010287_53470 [Streptomyces variabilis]